MLSDTQGLKFDVVVSNFDEDLDKAKFSGGAGERESTWLLGKNIYCLV
jgi:hypothetical protein